MTEWPLILAESESWPKILFGVIAVIFWIVSSIAGSIAKKKEQAEARRRMEEIGRETPVESGPPVLPPPLPSDAQPGAVRTRAEMERRMEAARARRRQGSRSDDEVFSDPSVLDDPSLPPDYDPGVETRSRQEAARRDQEMLARKRAELLLRAENIRQQTERAKREQQRIRVEAERREQLETQKVEEQRKARNNERSPDAGSPATRRTGTGAGVRVTAEVLHRHLTAQTLRQQFIITELFQPPVALRPDRFREE